MLGGGGGAPIGKHNQSVIPSVDFEREPGTWHKLVPAMRPFPFAPAPPPTQLWMLANMHVCIASLVAGVTLVSRNLLHLTMHRNENTRRFFNNGKYRDGRKWGIMREREMADYTEEEEP